MKKIAQKKMPPEFNPPAQARLDYDRETSHRAYELWEATGGQHGDDLRHWLEAKREVKARRQSSGAGSR